jgi:hypothetical protein
MSPQQPDGDGGTHVGRFNFDLATALGEQLKSHFDTDLRAKPMTLARVERLNRTQGVYALYRGETLVYIGQAIDLRKRLLEHWEKITGRQRIRIREMRFKCTYIDAAWIPVTHEKALLDVFKTQVGLCAWNGKGFGIHDPGRNRETTNKSPLGFDSLFPIKRDWPCDWVSAGHYNAKELLELIKGRLPFLFRYHTDNPQNWQAGSVLYNDLILNVPRDSMPFDELLAHLRPQMPGEWYATLFPGHAILYPVMQPQGDQKARGVIV